MEMALTFNDVTLSPISHQNNLWIRAVELAHALGYAQENSVSRIYRSNSDEFTPDMTQVIEIFDGADSALSTKARIFSLRGCHLVAMFARTPVAKAFRRWVLDVLDKLDAEQHAALSSPTDDAEGHLAAIREHIRQIHRHEEALFLLARKALPSIRTAQDMYSPARRAGLTAFQSMEDCSGALDYSLRALESAARAMLGMGK